MRDFSAFFTIPVEYVRTFFSFTLQPHVVEALHCQRKPALVPSV
jgi:hypothetical protein